MAIDYQNCAIPKPSHRIKAKLEARAEEARQMRECFAAVTERDESCCRVCGKFCRPRAISVLEKAHMHHIQYRSQGGQHTSDNCCLLCASCHAAVHDAKLRLEGNADERDSVTGRLNGIKVERMTESGWSVERFA